MKAIIGNIINTIINILCGLFVLILSLLIGAGLSGMVLVMSDSLDKMSSVAVLAFTIVATIPVSIHIFGEIYKKGDART